MVELEPAGADHPGAFRISVEGKESALDARALGQGAWSIVETHEASAAQGSLRFVQVDGPLTKLAIVVSHPDGEPRTVIAEVSVPRTSSVADGGGAADGTAPLTLRAPIPGKIVKVLVAAADHVKAGQPVVVLEAMKMENEVRSPRDALVAQIHVREGQSVDSGQDLVSLS